MLRFFKYSFLVFMIFSFMACPSPSTAQKPVDQNPGDSGYVPPAGLPGNIENIIDQAGVFWSGTTATGDVFLFERVSAQGGYYKIEIIAKGSSNKTSFYAIKGSGIVQNGVWEANFYLLNDKKNDFDLGTEMECRMKFLTLREAEVQFFPKKQSDKTKDYGTFKATAV